MDANVWNTWTASLDSTEIKVRLPKFTLEYEASLRDVLTALGMGIAFGSAADFGGIVPGGGLYISKVKHKTFLDVNEEGTEAAAATNVVVAVSRRLFSVDRPFFFVIRETFSGSILFMGRIMDPAG